MVNNMNSRSFDLEERTFIFAKNVRAFIKNLNNNLINNEDSKQLIRSSGSVGANYIEANEALSKKDFIYRLKISRKEVKESCFWLRLIKNSNDKIDSDQVNELINESIELKKILSSIILKSN